MKVMSSLKTSSLLDHAVCDNHSTRLNTPENTTSWSYHCSRLTTRAFHPFASRSFVVCNLLIQFTSPSILMLLIQVSVRLKKISRCGRVPSARDSDDDAKSDRNEAYFGFRSLLFFPTL